MFRLILYIALIIVVFTMVIMNEKKGITLKGNEYKMDNVRIEWRKR